MATPEKGAKRVLVLDPDPIRAAVTAEAVAALGYPSQTEMCPGKAVHAFLEERFDLLLTINQMPALNGFQVAYLIRTMGLFVPVILVAEDAASLCPDDLRLVGILGVIDQRLSRAEFQPAFDRLMRLSSN